MGLDDAFNAWLDYEKRQTEALERAAESASDQAIALAKIAGTLDDITKKLDQ